MAEAPAQRLHFHARVGGGTLVPSFAPCTPVPSGTSVGAFFLARDVDATAAAVRSGADTQVYFVGRRPPPRAMYADTRTIERRLPGVTRASMDARMRAEWTPASVLFGESTAAAAVWRAIPPVDGEDAAGPAGPGRTPAEGDAVSLQCLVGDGAWYTLRADTHELYDRPVSSGAPLGAFTFVVRAASD